MGKQALEGTRLNAFGVDPDDLYIPGYDDKATDHALAELDASRFELDEATVLNIQQLGVLESVLVTKEGDKVTVVDGRRRVLHAREANKRLRKQGAEPILVPCFVRKQDITWLAGVSRSLNAIRKDDTPLAKARWAEKLRAMGHDDTNIARFFGVTEKAVQYWDKLLETTAKVQKAVESGSISAFAASELAGLPKEEQEQKLEEILASGVKPTAERVRAATKKRKNGAGEDEGPHDRPRLGLLKKIYKCDKKNGLLHDESRMMLGYILGARSHRGIKGITEILEIVDPDPIKSKKEGPA